MMRDTRPLLGLRDGTPLRCLVLSKAETIALMIDAEHMTARELAACYGVRTGFVCRLWDRVYDAGGIVGYRLALRRRPGREWRESRRAA